jgi:4-amino-4-deoxy-L-arabinose transferase-like glycosyltransferase
MHRMQPLERNVDPPRWAQWGVLLAALFLVWHSLGNHALFPPDEGRYASVSGWMAEHGNWLEPQLRDQVHLTKPPLTYWAQAACVRAFGHGEFAVRFPSAMASTVLLVSLFAFARRTGGALTAMLAVGLLASMPLFQIVGRLAITDPMLSAWWWLALCAAWLAVDAGRASGRRHFGWIAAFWLACALVGLTKGPLVLAPPAIVAAWLFLAGRLREVRFLLPSVGLPLALAPLAVVAYLYWHADPARASRIWSYEFVDRFTGDGGHDDPWWILLPAFLGGLFPATAMMMLPWFNMSPARAWGFMRGGDLRALLVVAVVLPLIGFSALSGKEVTYILPLAAPLALLVAGTVARWVDGSVADLPAGITPPDVRITAGIAMSVVGIGIPVAAAVVVLRGLAPAWAPGWTLVWMTIPLLPAVAAAWIAMSWWKWRERRLPALGACFVASFAIWLGFHRAEDTAMQVMGAQPVAEAIAAEDKAVLVYQLRNLTIDWYLGRWLDFELKPAPMRAWIEAHPGGLVLTGEAEIAKLRKTDPDMAGWLRPRRTFEVWPMRQALLCDVVR